MRKQLKPSDAALKEAIRRWGKNAAVRFDPHGIDKDERAKAHEAHAALRARKPTVRTGPEWQAWRKEEQELFGKTIWYRCTVGAVVMGLFFEVKGQGDTWAEAFGEFDRKEAADRERYAALRAETAS